MYLRILCAHFSRPNRATGIMRCDYIAEGVIKASKELQMTIPLIVRLKGTKEAEAKQYVTRE